MPACRFVPVLVCGVWLAVSSCVSLGMDREPPEQQRYVLEAHRTGSDSSEPGADATGTAPVSPPRGVLEVRPFHVAQAYANRPFVYRVAEHRVETDFYHEFHVPPGLALGELCRGWLADCGLFAAVVGPGHRLDPDLILEGDVEALYGDFRDPGAPAAVLELRVFVLGVADRVTVHSTRLRERVPLSGAGPAALVAGWNTAFARAMERLEDELR